ncbi:TraB/GumN family protein [Pontixanthobacter aestiaquae]|uniref:TraB/GumN family protein n=1 Tax=Pontixanthobacter aestiaquae TaxID=1509367 RepID=A0A844Z9K2_9SPHN|nr:TraB/GumN family protein [Pontixanthobacter aestiaquae]MDN3645471.1 TraB/GumN family protein [Pontixanthobacter aestiaquae]MXO83530.1 TraB/GumN family protein [Pontixanthobacter aestiaquae]
MIPKLIPAFQIKRKIMGLVALALLASCSSPAEQFPPPSPALWEVTSTDGTREGWLFGTIHELPDGVNWRTDALNKALGQSEWLMVEVGDLDDSGKVSQIFAELALSAQQPPLIERVDQEHREQLVALMTAGDFKNGDFAQVETWAAALTLARIFSAGKPENGVDRILIGEFAAKIELEGARKQLSIFDSLAEEDQRDLLEGIIRESSAAESGPRHRLAKSWLQGDLDALLDPSSDTILSDPELRAALLTNRNTAWVETITEELPQKGPMMIAVGAAHMLGEDGLPALLRKSGYTVERIQ